MRISENPFFILGVTPDMPVEQINEMADDKCFMDEENEGKYEEARSILTNPRQRLEAEVGWFYEQPDIVVHLTQENLSNVSVERWTSVREVVFYCCEKLFLIAPITVQDMTEQLSDLIIKIDRRYESVFDEEETDNLYNLISSSRKKAHMFMNDDINQVKNVLHEVLENNIQKALSCVMKYQSIDTIVNIANQIANQEIKPSIGRVSKQYHDVIRIFIDLYNGEVQNVLDEKCEKIEKMTSLAEEYTESAQLQPLFTEVKEFDLIAQPLQLYFQDLGQANSQKQSVDVYNILSQLVIFYTEKKELPELSLAITEFAQKIFAENPEMREILTENSAYFQKQVSFLKELKGFGSLKAEFERLMDDIECSIIRKNGKENDNRKNIMAKKGGWLKILHGWAKKMTMLSNENQEQVAAVLAIAYYHLAMAFTWGELWDYTYVLLREGLPYAKKWGNDEIIGNFMKGLQKYSQSCMITQDAKMSKNVTELDHKRRRIGSYFLSDVAITRKKSSQALNKIELQEKNLGISKSNIVKILLLIVIIVIFFSTCMDSKSNTKKTTTNKSTKNITTQVPNQSKGKTEYGNRDNDDIIEYKEPPVGRGNELNIDELHWIAREEIRIKTMRRLIKNNHGVREFNKIVSHYNDRASYFKYRRDSWDRAKADVEKHRAEIEREAKKEVSDNGWDI